MAGDGTQEKNLMPPSCSQRSGGLTSTASDDGGSRRPDEEQQVPTEGVYWQTAAHRDRTYKSGVACEANKDNVCCQLPRETEALQVGEAGVYGCGEVAPVEAVDRFDRAWVPQ
jgi:hypothetical protein